MYHSTEISSGEILSDNPLHQQQLFPYQEVAKRIMGDVLELGCGWGRGAALLQASTRHYTGIDKNRSLITSLRTTHRRAQFFAATLPTLDFIADESFDHVVSFQVIEHIADDNQFVQEAYRVLRPGGQLFLTTINRAFSLTRNPWHVREYDPTDLGHLLKRHFPAGAVELQGISGSPRMMAYHEQNRISVRQIMRLDIFDLQHRLPSPLLRLPYELLNRYNRNRLLKADNLAACIDQTDFFVGEDPATCLDLFAIATKPVAAPVLQDLCDKVGGTAPKLTPLMRSARTPAHTSTSE